MRKDQATMADPNRYAILMPTNEWEQPTIFGLQTGSRDAARRRPVRQLSTARSFAGRSSFTFSLFDEGLAPARRNTEISNVWEEFARGYFAMYITGPVEHWRISPPLAARDAGQMGDRAAAAARGEPHSAFRRRAAAGW